METKRPPIVVDQAGEATNWTPATKQYIDLDQICCPLKGPIL